MIHQYKNNGYNIVMDVCSGAIHVVDDVTYDVIALYEEKSLEEIENELSYSKEDIEEAYKEVTSLKEEGLLFTEDIYEDYIKEVKSRKTVVKALCLHIAHDCNLACRYCFAEEGEYKGHRELMSAKVGKAALDFLVANSGNRHNLEVDFFGGEPTMNFGVVKEVVEYGRSLEEKHNKHFRFTLTTNGVLLNDEIMEFANKEMDNVVLSVDGRKEIHDYMRPTRNGKPSYDLIMPKFIRFAESRHQQKYYVRGTFTNRNLDFSKDVLHLADLGFEQISMEPVVGQPEEPYAIQEKDLPQIFDEYDRLAKEMIKREKAGTVTIKSGIPTEQSKKSMQFIEKLNVYSDFIKTNGQYFSRSNTQICKTFRQAKTTIKKKKTTGANCVMPVNWALKEMGFLATNANFYSKTNGNFSGVSANMKKNLVTFKKGDVVTEAGDLIGMKVVDAAKADLLVRGDIIANQSFTHTYVFDSFSNGKIYVYEAGGNANGLGYSKVGCGPFYAKQYNGLRIAGLMRWK